MGQHIEWAVQRASIEQCNARGMSDAAIADYLGCATSTIYKQRHLWGIHRADKFVSFFCKQYGNDAVECYRLLYRDGASLARIGRHFGFTREYARQVKGHLMLRELL